MSVRRLTLLGILLLSLCWLFWPDWWSVPEDFRPLSDALRRAESIELVVGWPDGPLGEDSDVTITVGPGRQGDISVSAGRVTWSGSSVKIHTDEFAIPVLDLPPKADDLYSSLRRGFRDATWEEIPPPRLGMIPLAPDAAWASVVLPFSWAEGAAILLAVDPEDGSLQYLGLQGRTAPFTVRAEPMRGGVRTVTLSEHPLVRLPVRRLTLR